VIAVESIILAAIIIKEWRKGNAATIIYKRTIFSIARKALVEYIRNEMMYEKAIPAKAPLGKSKSPSDFLPFFSHLASEPNVLL
jgi:hypothetical protein